MPEFIEKEYKSIINKLKFIDNWFWARYTINPYNGCLFGCVYCDARSEKYFMPEDFENKIIIKKDVGKLLDKRLSKARTLLPDVVCVGGVTDGYQAAEKKFGNTRQLLEVLAKHKYPVHIITKSNLVLNDIDLINEIGNNTWSCVSLTITTTDKNKASFLDNRAPSPEERLYVIKKIKEKAPHVQTGVLLIPLVPFLCDSDKDLENIVTASKNAGADYILFGGSMTMRDTQALWFLKKLKENYPELLPEYEKLYRFKYSPDKYTGSYTPDSTYNLPKIKLLFELCDKYKINYRIKRFIPDDFRKANYLVSEKLLNESYKKQMLGQNGNNLFWAGQNIQNLSEPLENISDRNELTQIRNVYGEVKNKVESYLKSVV